MCPQHVITYSDLLTLGLEELLQESLRVKHARTLESIQPHSLPPRIMASLFYEPSTRTRLSFESAMIRIGGNVIGTENAGEFSSAVKGESLTDSIKIVSGYADVIVLRHSQLGSAKVAAEVSSVPVINAGDGAGEHPTQALLDYFSIWEKFRDFRDVRLVVVGDLKHGRTVHSLISLIAKVRNENCMIGSIQCVAPETLQLPEDILQTARESGIAISIETELTSSVISSSHVLYLTRTQTERGSSMGDQREKFLLTPEKAAFLQDEAIVLHPLPRNNELPDWFDSYPQARYFSQAKNGLYTRITLLQRLLH